MSDTMKPSRDYSTMPREEAVRHFANRELKLKEDIRALSTADKFRLVADCIDAGDRVVPSMAINVARLAITELEARPTSAAATPTPGGGRVVHCKRSPYDVYIGRPSKWGNPYPIPRFYDRVCDPDRILARYEQHVLGRPELVAALPELRGKVLGCWCAPKPCHGDVLLRLANA